MAEVSSSSIKLDPSGAAALIQQGQQAGVAATSAATRDSSVACVPSSSPVDVASVAFGVAGTSRRMGFAVTSGIATARRASGGLSGVESMSAVESQNAVRETEVGPEAQVQTGSTLI